MKVSNIGNQILIVIILLSAVFSGYQMYLESEEISVGNSLVRSWNICFAFLIAMWAVEDAKKQGMHRYLGFGMLVLILWPLVLLYHMPASRGVEGVVYYVGFWGLYTAPFFLGLAVYAYA